MDFQHFATAPDGAKTYIRIVRDPDGTRRIEVREVTPAANIIPVFDDNLRRAVETHVGKTSRGNSQRHWAHVARIPVSLYYQLVKKLGRPHENRAAWKKWFNDSENRLFRTSEGNV